MNCSINPFLARSITGRKPAGSHLVEQRLKEVVIGAIDKRDLDRRLGQTLGRVQAAETASDDDDAVAPAGRGSQTWLRVQ